MIANVKYNYLYNALCIVYNGATMHMITCFTNNFEP